jgi:hypothetical protein
MQLRSHVKTARMTLSRWLARTWRQRPRNFTDPITLDRLTPPVFKQVDAHGHVHAFDPATLAAYFRASGHFINPVTREVLNNVELRRLQKLLPASEPSLVDARARLEAERAASFSQQADMHTMQMQIELSFHDLLAYAVSPGFRINQYRTWMGAIRTALATLAHRHGIQSARATAEAMQITTLNLLTMLLIVDPPDDGSGHTFAVQNLDQRMIPDVAFFMTIYSDGDVIMRVD